LKFIEGLEPPNGFHHRLEYGNMWHVCEEAHAAKLGQVEGEKRLKYYCQELVQRYPDQGAEIDKWYRVCKVQFPVYMDFWRKHPEVIERKPVSQEQVFDVKYRLPSGRMVRLRGKFDAVDLIKKDKRWRVYLQENKARGEVDELETAEQLQFDLQTGMYLVALGKDNPTQYPIRGVRYNVIRRPLSGGLHSIRQHKPSKSNPLGETKDQFYARLGGLIAEEPEHYFKRWTADYSTEDIERFEKRILQPILESLWDWWDYMKMIDFSPWGSDNPINNSRHWQHPHGVYNVINEKGRSDVEEFLVNGSTVGLIRNDKLFGELA
jgi:hypothetical protein